MARIIDADSRLTRQTGVGGLIGTLAYISPEQLLADPLEVDARTDVYAVGLTLFELLAGRLPYEVIGSIPEAARAIREDEPVLLAPWTAPIAATLKPSWPRLWRRTRRAGMARRLRWRQTSVVI